MEAQSSKRLGSCAKMRRGEKRWVDATLRSKRQYAPFGANPMARLSMRLLADCLIGRSAKWGEFKISRATSASEVITTGVDPKLKAMSFLAVRFEAMEASVR